VLSSDNKQFQKIDKLIIKCQFSEALRSIDNILNLKNISDEDLAAGLVLKSEISNKLGEYAQAITFAEQVLGGKSAPVLFQVDALLHKSEAFWRIGKFKEHMIALKTSEQLLLQLEAIPESEIEKRQILLLYLKGGVPYVKGEYDLAIEYANQGLKVANKIKSLKLQTILLISLGNNYKQKGEKDKAKDYFKQSIAIAKKQENKQDMALAYHGLARITYVELDFKKADNLFKEALALNEEIGSKRDVPYIYNDLANNHNQMLKLDLALENYLKYLSYQGENIVGLHIIFSNIGYVYYLKGDLENALKYYLKSLKICEAIGDKRRIMPKVLYNLITLLIDKSDVEGAKEYLEKLELISKLANNERITRMYRFASAFILKASKRMSDWSQAINIFEELLKSEKLATYWKVVSLINISEILLKELHLSAEKEILDDIKKRITKLILLADENKYFILLAKAYWLNAQLALAELDLKTAKTSLMKASMITEDKGLMKLADDISKEQNKLENQLGMWEDLVQQKKPLVESLKHLSLEDGIIEMKKEIVLEERDERTGKPFQYNTLFALRI